MTNDDYQSSWDTKRDLEFYEPPERPVTDQDMLDLCDELHMSSNSIRQGLSEIGIDPDQFDDSEINEIEDELYEKHGLELYADEWMFDYEIDDMLEQEALEDEEFEDEFDEDDFDYDDEEDDFDYDYDEELDEDEDE